MKSLLFIIVLSCLVACSTSKSPSGKAMVRYPKRSLADWEPDKAVAEAQKDIAMGTAKIYISGTIAAYAPGISSDQEPLVKSLPNADAGIGCVIQDAELRKAQFEYARRYNAYVVQHLPKH
jgi:hypothetical protein